MDKYRGFPVYKPMKAYRGDTFEFALRIIGRNPSDGTAYLLDTADFTARYQVRSSVDSTVVITAAPCIVGVSGTGVNQRNLTVTIPHSVTSTYPHGAKWRYDLELTDPSGRRLTMMYGPFEVQGDVAK